MAVILWPESMCTHWYCCSRNTAEQRCTSFSPQGLGRDHHCVWQPTIRIHHLAAVHGRGHIWPWAEAHPCTALCVWRHDGRHAVVHGKETVLLCSSRLARCWCFHVLVWLFRKQLSYVKVSQLEPEHATSSPLCYWAQQLAIYNLDFHYYNYF